MNVRAFVKDRLYRLNLIQSIPSFEMVVVEITTFCNLGCAGCIRTVGEKAGWWGSRHISVENFSKIIDALPKVKLFIPQGIGEPTFHPELNELIGIAARSGKFEKIEINSNGLLRPVEYYADLFAAGLTNLTISVDTLDPALVSAIREKTDVDKLKQVVTALINSFGEKVGIRVTVGSRNVSQIEQLLGGLVELGARKVWLQPFFDMGENADGVMTSEVLNDFLSSLPGLTAKFLELEIQEDGFLPSDKVCSSPWYSPAITVDGILKPCCMILQQDPISLGNVLETPLEELWTSTGVVQFRKNFRHRSPSCCANCPSYVYRK